MATSSRVRLKIPVRHFGDIVTWGEEEREKIVQSAMVVLEKVGVRIQGEQNLRLLDQAGGGVNWETDTVHFGEEEVLATAHKLAQDSPGDERAELLVSERPSGFVVGNCGSLWFDWERGRAVPARRRDLRNLTRWAEGMDQIIGSNQFCLVQEKGLDPVLQLIDAFAIMFQHSTKPVYFYQPTEPIHLKYMKRLQELQNRRGYSQMIEPFEFVNPPLTLGERAIRMIMARADAGLDTIGMGAMTTAGMGAPVTMPGFVTMATAEVLGGLCVVRRLRPRVKLMASLTGGILDMRTGRLSYQCPWAAAVHYMAVDVFRNVFRARLHYYWGYRDANEPGMQACYEWALLNMFHRCVDGRGASEIGGLANGNLFSPEQAVLDMQMEAEASQLLAGYQFDEAAIGLEMILEAGHNAEAYTTHAHTFSHFRDCLPFSGFWLRGLPATAQHEPARSQTQRLLDEAHELCEEARKRGEDVETDRDLAQEAWAIQREMAQELNVPCPEPLID